MYWYYIFIDVKILIQTIYNFWLQRKNFICCHNIFSMYGILSR